MNVTNDTIRRTGRLESARPGFTAGNIITNNNLETAFTAQFIRWTFKLESVSDVRISSDLFRCKCKALAGLLQVFVLMEGGGGGMIICSAVASFK